MLYGNQIRTLIKKENWPMSFPRDYLRTSGKGGLYGQEPRTPHLMRVSLIIVRCHEERHCLG